MAGAAKGQTDEAWMALHFVRPGLAVPKFDLKIYEGGSGSYVAENMASGTGANRYAVAPETPAVSTSTQPLALNGLARAKIFKLLRETNGLARCASPRKGIADTGAKTLMFHEVFTPDVICEYNYTEIKPLTELTDLLQGMAAVMDAGRKLERDHRFDRLGLDGDVGFVD